MSGGGKGGQEDGREGGGQVGEGEGMEEGGREGGGGEKEGGGGIELTMVTVAAVRMRRR